MRSRSNVNRKNGQFKFVSRGKDRRATFDDVGDHNVTTKTILGGQGETTTRQQQVGVPHGAHHRRILEGGKKILKFSRKNLVVALLHWNGVDKAFG